MDKLLGVNLLPLSVHTEPMFQNASSSELYISCSWTNRAITVLYIRVNTAMMEVKGSASS